MPIYVRTCGFYGVSNRQFFSERIKSYIWLVFCQKSLSQSVDVSLCGCNIFPVCIWAVHFLSTSEEVQEKLHQELEDVLGSEPVSLDKIPQLR